MTITPETIFNKFPVIELYGSESPSKEQLLQTMQGKNMLPIFTKQEQLRNHKADFSIYMFSDKADDALLPDIKKENTFVICSDLYPNKEILQNLSARKRINLYASIDPVSEQLLSLLGNFKTIEENMHKGGLGDPRTGNMFFWDGGPEPRGRKCPAVVTNNIKGPDEFNCIGLDDWTTQSFRPGNGERALFTIEGTEERLLGVQRMKQEDIDKSIKRLKLKIAKMSNLKF